MNDKYIRREQDSNLRGETPLDFKSNALTTRPSQRLLQIEVIARTVVREFHLSNEPDISNTAFLSTRTALRGVLTATSPNQSFCTDVETLTMMEKLNLWH